jgi:hypothetical protein
MPPLAVAALALLQSGGANAWGPLTAFAVGIYGAGVLLCFVIGGGFLSAGTLDSANKTKGVDWIRRGFVGGVFGMLAFSIYQFFDGLF